jgi:TPP-dependent indolepyruvate ferredoxin oxidoreductase alpha subunit
MRKRKDIPTSSGSSNGSFNTSTSMKVSEAIASALRDAGVGVCTFVPGYGGSEVFRILQDQRIGQAVMSYHEEPAYTIAHGAALCGMRAASLFKTHGIMKAGNSVSDSLYAATNAGFVTILFEDEGGSHSDSVVEAVPFLEGIGMPHIRTASRTVYEDILGAFRKSEDEQLPCAILINAEEVSLETSFTPFPGSVPSKEYTRNIQQHLVAPIYAEYQHRVLMAKKRKEDWKTIPVPRVPVIPDETRPHWRPTVESYMPVFDVFRDIRGEIVTGDTSLTSQFSGSPYHCIDMCTYMGGSIPLAIGAYLAGKKGVWAVTGDFGFMSAGHLGLFEAYNRRIPLKILVFHNGKAAATGGQLIGQDMLEILLSGYKPFVRHIHNPADKKEIREVLGEAASVNELRIVISESLPT